jgi:peroxiredoxin
MRKIIFLLAVLFTANANAQTTLYPDGLKVGDKAPLFSANDQNGETVSLKNVLEKGPVVIIFYRGQWCPFCNKYLSRLNDSLQFIAGKGAAVIAIAPETVEGVTKTIEKTKASFSIISDADMAIMKSYKVNFAVDTATVSRYKKYGIDFDAANGSNGANLPVPATYIISKEGVIKYAYFNTDYRKRPPVQELLDNL